VLNNFISHIPNFEEALKSPIPVVPISVKAPSADSSGIAVDSSRVGTSTRRTRKCKASTTQTPPSKMKKLWKKTQTSRSMNKLSGPSPLRHLRVTHRLGAASPCVDPQGKLLTFHAFLISNDLWHIYILPKNIEIEDLIEDSEKGEEIPREMKPLRPRIPEEDTEEVNDGHPEAESPWKSLEGGGGNR
jgi:hypothetical protein